MDDQAGDWDRRRGCLAVGPLCRWLDAVVVVGRSRVGRRNCGSRPRTGNVGLRTVTSRRVARSDTKDRDH